MFRADGTWVPDQSFMAAANQSTRAMANPGSADTGYPQMAQQDAQLQFMSGHPGGQGFLNFQNSSPTFNPNGADPRLMFLQAGITPQNSTPVQNTQTNPIQNQGGASSPQNNFSNYSQSPPQQLASAPNLQSAASAAAPMSSMQSFNHANPQAVQNYLQSLNQNPAVSGNSNAWQNPQGVLGQGAQAGFKGFETNPSQGYSQTNFANYSPPQLGSMQSPNVTATTGPTASSGVKAGGGGNSLSPLPPHSSPTYFQPSNKTFGLAASDIQAKQNIQPVNNELEDFLNSLNAYSYEYKDPKYGDGRRISPMAQEIEQTPLGKAAISTNQEGYKIVDYGKLGGTMLASLSLLNHKYNELEKQLKESIKTSLINKGKIK